MPDRRQRPTMRRTGLRALMVLVGVAPLVVYAGVAYLAYRLLAAVWVARGDLFAVGRGRPD